LLNHLEAYRRHLEAKNNDERYVSQALAHCKAIIEGISTQFITGLDAGTVADWLAARRRASGMGISTSRLIAADLAEARAAWIEEADADPCTRLHQTCTNG